MYYVTNSRPTRLDRRRARQRIYGIILLILGSLLLIWGIVEYTTKQTAPAAPAEVEVQ